jgi:hypothetical protein
MAKDGGFQLVGMVIVLYPARAFSLVAWTRPCARAASIMAISSWVTSLISTGAPIRLITCRASRSALMLAMREDISIVLGGLQT